MSKTENQSPNKGTWEWNNTMLLHQQKQNRSPQHLPHHNRPFLLPHQLSSTTERIGKLFYLP